MGKYDKFIDIDQSPDTRNNWRLAIEELKERAASMTRMISYAAAKEIYDAILEGIPGGNDYAELKKSLKLVEVSGAKKGQEAAYAIYVNPKGRRIKKIDAGRTIITIQAKRGRTPPPDDVVVLEERGPWTADTIPFWPRKSEAVITQRKVSKKQVDDLANKLKKEMPDIARQLLEAGRRIDPMKPNSPGRIKRNAKAVPDLAMQALSLEFGDSGVRSNPVFRKAIGQTKRTMGGLSKRFVEITDAMTDPNSKKYKNWPPRISKISSGTAASFKGFQKRLGF
jgi:hypothetical protein